ncbi:MAG: maturation protein [Sanya fiers-like virus 24]|nr:MAG: maturation protein [Sanya fiers-like virus 24]
MPITYKRVAFTSMTRTRPYKESPWGPWTYATSTEVSYSRDAPTTTTRKRPVDLITNETRRTVTTETTFDTTSSIVSARNNTYQSFGGAFQNSYLISGALTPTVLISRDAMYNSIRKRIREESVNIAMMLAEFSQTVELFKDAAKIIATRGRSIAKQLRKDKSKAVSKRYLQFQYGIAPLASDVTQLMKNMHESLYKPMYIRGVEKRTATGFRVSQLSPNSSLTTKTATAEVTRQVTYKTYYRARLSPAVLQRSLAASGFFNPFSLAYELIPFSFVLDWWINIGDVLASLENQLVFDSIEVIDSSRTETKVFITGNSDISGTCGRNTRVDSRSGVTLLSPIATVQLKKNVSSRHIANGLALLHVARR